MKLLFSCTITCSRALTSPNISKIKRTGHGGRARVAPANRRTPACMHLGLCSVSVEVCAIATTRLSLPCSSAPAAFTLQLRAHVAAAWSLDPACKLLSLPSLRHLPAATLRRPAATLLHVCRHGTIQPLPTRKTEPRLRLQTNQRACSAQQVPCAAQAALAQA
jgi:hypothetical protein